MYGSFSPSGSTKRTPSAFPAVEGSDPPRRPRIHADPSRERLATSATVVTAVRTVGSVILAGLAAYQGNLALLVLALAVYWIGDSLDGFVARVRDCETRTGAVLDILCDRLCCAAFYVGLAWMEPHLVPAIFVYLAEFMVVDFFISIGFLAWPITSPNYFYVVDRTLFLWNWSKPGKTLNSALFAVLLLVTSSMPLGSVVAVGLLVIKLVSFRRMLRIGLPIPSVALPELAPAGATHDPVRSRQGSWQPV
ncbi:CDP-alcohol phosphatidyltransferase family protein [Marmoricola sp. URHB0036]|uniref:CDP-alcohol phosphatidyltransferase family protein n=1 Tax=Marmoricola sp. URHB0036 TaxID=1298863 RepID=UPI0003FE0800|nr:CDP-alcohol phosphatidyltransferase family protein [Marmoricola sp. URHB0036]